MRLHGLVYSSCAAMKVDIRNGECGKAASNTPPQDSSYQSYTSPAFSSCKNKPFSLFLFPSARSESPITPIFPAAGCQCAVFFHGVAECNTAMGELSIRGK